jgi:ABC-type polysaccharide transport system, permease component
MEKTAKSLPRTAGEVPLTWGKDLRRNWVMYALFLPVAAYFIIFNYIPMSGIVIAFKDFSFARGIFGSEWVGMQNFIDLFTGEGFGQVMRNTICMALLNLTLGFFAPIVLALIITEVPFKKYRRVAQTLSYVPHFVATVVVAQLVRELLGTNGGVTQLLTMLGFPQQNWVANPNVPVFWLINCFTDIWQGAGFGTIVYIAAIHNINGDLHEAAAIDGANRWQRLTQITIPSLIPIISIFFALRIGLVFVTGFDKVLLLYMPSTYATADVLTTYTYRMAFGAGGGNYGLSAASGLFQSAVGTFLLLFSNWLNARLTKNSLF